MVSDFFKKCGCTACWSFGHKRANFSDAAIKNTFFFSTVMVCMFRSGSQDT